MMVSGNDLTDGFKETEIGPIPVDWGVVRLGQTAEYKKATINPQSYPDEVFDYYSIPAYQVSDEPALERGGEIRSQKLVVEPGMVLFGKLNPRVPKVWRVVSTSSRRKIASTEFIPLTPIEGKTSSEFLYYLAWSDHVLPKSQELVSGSTPSRQRVDVKAFLRIPIPLPPLPEQRRIAHVLSTIQRAIAAQDDLIAAAREMKRSLMQRLFTYGPGPEPAPTKETEIGEMPEHWEVVRLGGMAEFKNGINFRSDQKGRGILTVDVLNMYAGGIAVQMGNLYRVDTDVKEHYLLQPNDILLVRSSLKQEGVGWPALFTGYTESVTFCGFLIRARLTSTSVLSEFLVNYLRLPSARQLLVSKSGKVAITNINQGNLRSLHVCLPPLQEQEEIVKALRTVDGKIAAEEQRKAALRALFKAMLHQLMTGQIRAVKGEA